MYIDTHAHLYKNYYDNIDDIFSNALINGVNRVIINGVDNISNKEVIELCSKYDIVYGAVGYHPTELDNFNDCDLSILKKQINNPKIVAIGEIGLDYHYENTNKELQIKVFRSQLDLAKELDIPVIIHSRDAALDTLNILKEYAPIKGVLHCYSYSKEMAIEFIKLGLYLGIGGVVTFKNSKVIKEVVEEVSLSYIVLETDSPYLTPDPYRNEVNESKYIPIIAKEIAEIKNIDVKEVENVTTKNAGALFDLKL